MKGDKTFGERGAEDREEGAPLEDALDRLLEDPISLDEMEDPVVDGCKPTSHTFERSVIEAHIAVSHDCPISHEPLVKEDLRAVVLLNDIRGVVQRAAARKDDEIRRLQAEVDELKQSSRPAGESLPARVESPELPPTESPERSLSPTLSSEDEFPSDTDGHSDSPPCEDGESYLYEMERDELFALAQESPEVLEKVVEDACTLGKCKIDIIDLQDIVFNPKCVTEGYYSSDAYVDYCYLLLVRYLGSAGESSVVLDDVLKNRKALDKAFTRLSPALFLPLAADKLQKIISSVDIATIPEYFMKALLEYDRKQLYKNIVFEYAKVKESLYKILINERYGYLDDSDMAILVTKWGSVARKKPPAPPSADKPEKAGLSRLAFIARLFEDVAPFKEVSYAKKLERALKNDCLSGYLSGYRNVGNFDVAALAVFVTNHVFDLREGQHRKIVTIFEEMGNKNREIDELIKHDNGIGRLLLYSHYSERMLADPAGTLVAVYKDPDYQRIIDANPSLKKYIDGAKAAEDSDCLAMLDAELSAAADDCHKQKVWMETAKRVKTRSAKTPFEFNIALLGNKGVGKTTFLDQYAGFLTRTYARKRDVVDDVSVVNYLSDICDSDPFHAGAGNYLRKKQGIMIFFDLTDRGSFDCIGDIWWKEIEKYYREEMPPIMLVATKLDLEKARVVSPAEALALAKRMGATYSETSANLNTNVTDAFHQLNRQMIIKQEAHHIKVEDFGLHANELKLLKANRLLARVNEMNQFELIARAFCREELDDVFTGTKDIKLLDIAEEVRKKAYQCLMRDYENRQRGQPLRDALALKLFQFTPVEIGSGLFKRKITSPTVEKLRQFLKDKRLEGVVSSATSSATKRV